MGSRIIQPAPRLERELRPVTRDDALYITDNGATLCGAHLGSSAKYTGFDISGQPILEVTPDVVAEAKAMGEERALRCEHCHRRPSAIWRA